MEIETTNGGPAFPVPGLQHDDKFNGMTLRQYYAGKLMHAELMTCGVPGEACEALVRAAADRGMDPIDLMAQNSMDGADALIRASANPPQRVAVPFDPSVLPEIQLEAMDRLTNWGWFHDLPSELQAQARSAADHLRAINDPDGIPF